MPVPRCLMFKEVITMEVEFFDTAEEAAERLTKAMKAADARVQHWQAQVKPGDCLMCDSGEGFPIFGEVLEGYREKRLRLNPTCWRLLPEPGREPTMWLSAVASPPAQGSSRRTWGSRLEGELSKARKGEAMDEHEHEVPRRHRYCATWDGPVCPLSSTCQACWNRERELNEWDGFLETGEAEMVRAEVVALAIGCPDGDGRATLLICLYPNGR